MFDIGWSELLLIGIVALIAIGPKELPGAMRTLGQWVAKVRRMAAEFQNQFHEAMREAELADLKKEVDEMAAKAKSYARFDPVEDLRREVESAAGPPPELDSPLTSAPAGPPAPASATPDASEASASTPPTPAETEVAPEASAKVAEPALAPPTPSAPTSSAPTPTSAPAPAEPAGGGEPSADASGPGRAA